MDIKISYIIPIYNVQSYLKQCIESVLTQSYTNIEVILVNDGSTDNSGNICDTYRNLDKRVHVIHKKNGGLSDARNTGLLHATGDYIIFLDGDDFWINPNYLGDLVRIVLDSPECDFIGFNCSYYYTNSSKFINLISFPTSLVHSSDHNDVLISLVGTGTFPMSACLKIIKKELLTKNKIFFKKGLTAEDIPWFINLLEHSKNIKFINHYIYAYRQNVLGSITNNFSTKKFADLFSILKNEIANLHNRNFNKTAKGALLSFLAYEYCILLAHLNYLKSNDKKFYKIEMKKYTWLLNYTLNPKVKLVSNIYHVLGLNLIIIILFMYLKYKTRQSENSEKE